MLVIQGQRCRYQSKILMRLHISDYYCLLFNAFTVFVRPLLEYCSPVWNPHYHCDIEKTESVQRRFTKYIGFKNLPYNERLLRLNAETSEQRRSKSDLTLMYRTVYGHCGLKFASFFTLSDIVLRYRNTTVVSIVVHLVLLIAA